jgi:hypothetical protein
MLKRLRTRRGATVGTVTVVIVAATVALLVGGVFSSGPSSTPTGSGQSPSSQSSASRTPQVLLDASLNTCAQSFAWYFAHFASPNGGWAWQLYPPSAENLSVVGHRGVVGEMSDDAWCYLTWQSAGQPWTVTWLPGGVGGTYPPAPTISHSTMPETMDTAPVVIRSNGSLTPAS